MGDVVPFPRKVFTIERVPGGCPHCGEMTGFLNVGSTFWAICGKHRIKWHVGENLFCGWRNETPDQWEANAKVLASYQERNKLWPSPDPDAA